MAVDQADILRIAELARIRISEGDAAEVSGRIKAILELAGRLQALDAREVEPLANPLDAHQRLREDAVTEGDQRDEFLAIAPAKEAGLILVPKVIE